MGLKRRPPAIQLPTAAEARPALSAMSFTDRPGRNVTSMSTHPFAVGDRVTIHSDAVRASEHGVVWRVLRRLRVNVEIARVDGTGRPMRINPELLQAATADASGSTPTAVPVPYQAPFIAGAVVTIAGPGWNLPADTLYTVLRDSGTTRVACVKLGGDNGTYWRVGRSMITVVDPSRIRLLPATADE